jgi:CRISPR-associated endonuclease/helicase Cas3
MSVAERTSQGVAKQRLRQALGLHAGESPFPWQEELLHRMLNGGIPEVVDIPTGLGKTAAMAIWLVARACGAKLPRRLVYVVDRRAVVDQATDVALGLRTFVDGDPERKRALGLREDQPLPISTLRGQYVDNREWLDDPAAPAIIVGTVDMIGSRLLFEGYGVSRKMRPYHAGLLGADTLVVLDEAHLVPPFEHLLRTIATEPVFRPREERSAQGVPPFQLLSLSATGRTRNADVFGLTDADFEHQVLKKRLNAKKSLQIEPLDGETKLEEALAQQAWILTDNGTKAVRVLVYSDSREIAQKAKEAVETLAKGNKESGTSAVQADTELFVGGRRVFEREQAKERLRELGFIAGSKVELIHPVFLFATSAGEVGVDLDADHMVCDLVAWERMVQRLGRVNRRGDGKARVVVIVEPKPKANKKEQEALDKRTRNEELGEKERKRAEGYEKKVREWENRQKPLRELCKDGDESFDASPAALRDLKTRATSNSDLQRILDDATSPEPLRPALTRPLVEAWSMTSLDKHPGRPAIQPWLRGWIEDDPQTAVVWRTHLPVRKGGETPRKQEIEAFFEAAPLHTSEILETETFHVVKWLTARAKSVRKQQAPQDHAADRPRPCEEDVVAFALEPDGGLRRSFTLADLDAPEDKKDKGEFHKWFAGTTLVVDARLAGLKNGLLDENETTPPKTADGNDWLGEGVVGFRVRSIEASTVVSRERNWRERLRFASAVTEDGEASRWLLIEKWRHDAATEEDRSAATPQLLDEHECWAEERARRLAKALDLEEEDENLLALAARLHDEGKRAERWQRAFNAPKDGIYGKTEGPINYRLLDGYRHELGSLLRIERIEDDERVKNLSSEQRDLLLHVIAAHHGFARPVISTSGCDDKPPSVLEEKAAEIALRFARLQASWGPWGLAWWEALLRAADQQASRQNDAAVEQQEAQSNALVSTEPLQIALLACESSTEKADQTTLLGGEPS